ncbi:MAG: dethiobiotin synthase [Porticoccaceae bacterium]
MKYGYFIAGTDTEVGKTFAAAALLARAGQLGLRTAAWKPVAAGAAVTAQGLRNEDALTLLQACNQPLPYEMVNPVCLAPAIAPHIAAAEQGMDLDVAALLPHFQRVLDGGADFVLVEGAGGWRVPLNDRETLADLALALQLPVVLVVAMRLGCINHALLSAEAIARDGLPLAGWIANQATPDSMARHGENLDTLRRLLPAPLLGELPHMPGGDFNAAAQILKLPGEVEPAGVAL